MWYVPTVLKRQKTQSRAAAILVYKHPLRGGTHNPLQTTITHTQWQYLRRILSRYIICSVTCVLLLLSYVRVHCVWNMSIRAEISAERINNGDDVISVLILIAVCLAICRQWKHRIHTHTHIHTHTTLAHIPYNQMCIHRTCIAEKICLDWVI
jgi:hypothetical protein